MSDEESQRASAQDAAADYATTNNQRTRRPGAKDLRKLQKLVDVVKAGALCAANAEAAKQKVLELVGRLVKTVDNIANMNGDGDCMDGVRLLCVLTLGKLCNEERRVARPMTYEKLNAIAAENMPSKTLAYAVQKSARPNIL